MKKSLIFSLILGILFLSTISFTLINAKSATKKHSSIKSTPVKKSNCTASITGVTLVSVGPSSATISITYSGTPAHFSYGGYYNPTNIMPNTIPTTNLYTTTVTIPLYGHCGARVWFQCVCSDGTTVGATHGVLFGCGDPTIYF